MEKYPNRDAGIELRDSGLGGLMPMLQEVIKGLLARTLSYLNLLAGLVIIIGVVLIILGLYIWF